jgi:hypothetical protein
MSFLTLTIPCLSKALASAFRSGATVESDDSVALPCIAIDSWLAATPVIWTAPGEPSVTLESWISRSAVVLSIDAKIFNEDTALKSSQLATVFELDGTITTSSLIGE